jgi:hypothetical protein
MSQSITIKKRIISIKGYKCESCGLAEWLDNPIILELHHIDGNTNNNVDENLILLCPNCHSFTENWRKKKNTLSKEELNENRKKDSCIECGKKITIGAKRCKSCDDIQKIQVCDKISREELKLKIRTESFEEIGREFNISGNAIRKWCLRYSLPRTKKEIKTFSNEDWLKV